MFSRVHRFINRYPKSVGYTFGYVNGCISGTIFVSATIMNTYGRM